MNVYKQAVYSQSACNLSALCYSLPKIADALWEEIRKGNDGCMKWAPDTKVFNEHPVMRLLAEQFMHLTSGRDWSEAHAECEKRAEEKT